MWLTIELDREADGRWIADIPELNVLLYVHSKEEAVQNAEAAARQIIADRIAHGELPSQGVECSLRGRARRPASSDPTKGGAARLRSPDHGEIESE